VPARVLGVVGDLLEDVVIHVAGPPARGTDTPARIERRRGGSAANVAAAAARAGGAVRFVGRVGADMLGELLVGALAADGVDVRVQRGGRTGSVAVLVEPDGERTMLPDRGAAAELEAIDPAWLADLGWLHLTAYSLCGEPAGPAAQEAARRVRAADGRISVDVSSVAVVEAFGRSRFGDLLEQVAPDVVFANAVEARTLVGRPPGVLVVKDGPRPVVVTQPDGRTVEVDVPPIGPVTDTTGAGDAFAAGFLVAMLEGSPADVAARSGVALAVRSLGRVGE
jgi:sugar/nucleoside kinase (ribokinase family)